MEYSTAPTLPGKKYKLCSTPFAALLALQLLACSHAPGSVDQNDMGGGGPQPDLLPAEPVTVTVSVDGMGQVTSMPQGISCPGQCTARFPPTVKLQLIAQAQLRTAFMEWSGACAGGNTICQPTLSHDLTVTAHFIPRTCTADNWCQESPIPMEAQYLTKVWGSSPTDVWAVGWDGVIVHYNGIRWYLVPSNTVQSLIGLWASSATDLWAVGTGKTVLHGDGMVWGPVIPNASPELFAVWGSGPSDIWSYGGDPFGGTFFLHYDGTNWNKLQQTGNATYFGMWGSAANDIWAVGQGGATIHYDGMNWTVQSAITKSDLADIWGTKQSNMWAVGKNGVMMHYDGTSWQSQPMASANLLGIGGLNDQLAWAVGEGGTLLRYDGHSWTQAASGTTSNLRGVWASDDKNAWAVGDGVILRYIP